RQRRLAGFSGVFVGLDLEEGAVAGLVAEDREAIEAMRCFGGGGEDEQQLRKYHACDAEMEEESEEEQDQGLEELFCPNHARSTKRQEPTWNRHTQLYHEQQKNIVSVEAAEKELVEVRTHH
ncbi:unnamed protein product, partial [Heterosigma akashiwo]